VMRVVSEPEFREVILEKIRAANLSAVDYVTGPGRSGAVAAVYASHMTGIPFVPFGRPCEEMGNVLIVDTAAESGRTIRKAAQRYKAANPTTIVTFYEPPRVAFWYEAPKPQSYRKRTASLPPFAKGEK
jgi:hypothetical protein